MFGDGEWPDSARELFERPVLDHIAAELEHCHDRLVSPHWDRMRPVLDADIGYRGALLASGGARALFGDMHPDLRWSAGTLTMTDADTAQSVVRVRLGTDGLVLMPSVFGWPDVSVSRATSTQTILRYPVRGVATIWHAAGNQAAAGSAAEHLLGAARARVLSVLRSPASTTALASQLGVTPSAASQHLRFLHRGGLVSRQRSGREVLYQATDLGLALLQPLDLGKERGHHR